MKRIFISITSFVVLLILMVSLGIFEVSSSHLQQAKQQAIQAKAEGISLGLSRQMKLLQELVNALAQSPEVVAAFNKGDQSELQQTARQLEKLLPGALKIRLLIPGTQIQDNDSPAIGYADLDMVKESITSNQLPAIHDQDANRHLAIAARTLKNNLAIGVLLASINPAIIHDSLPPLSLDDSYLSLVQGELVLFEQGDSVVKKDDGGKLAVANTRWEVRFWNAQAIDPTLLWMILSIVATGIVLGCVSLFFGFRYFDRLFTKDCGTLLKVSKDLLSGKMNGKYPVNLDEMRVMISTLVQFRRVTDENGQEKPVTALNAAKLNDFLDEPEDFDFQNAEQLNQKNASTLPGKPVSMQTLDDSAEPVSSAMAHKSRSSIFKAFGIQGIVDVSLTKDLLFNIGQAFASEAKALGVQRIIMGYDGWLSNPAIAEVLAKGMITTGVDVMDIGMVPTPLVHFVAHHLEGSSIIITGSYSAAPYNGLKMMLKGEPLIGEGILQLKRRIDMENYSLAALGNIERNNRCTNDYIGALSDEIHIVRPMKVVLDCANGVTSDLGPKLLKTLGCEVIELFCEIDGNFPNHYPDPSRPDNLSDLSSAVQHYKADVGIALDGEGSRMGVVDSKGKIIWPDRLMMLFAKDVLENKPGTPIIYNASCSKYLKEQIINFGGQPLLSKTGQAFVRAKMQESDAKLAGEMSGHIFFKDRWFGFDDALYGAARLIQILSADPRNSAELFACFPEAINTPELVIELMENEHLSIMTTLRKNNAFKGAKINDADGLRVDFADGWGFIRATHSSPSLVLRFEADSLEALKRIQEQFKTALLKIKPDINLPF